MAKAYQCDRCMAYYTANKEVIVPGQSTNSIATGITINSTTSSGKRYELCDACLKDITDWLAFRVIVKSNNNN